MLYCRIRVCVCLYGMICCKCSNEFDTFAHSLAHSKNSNFIQFEREMWALKAMHFIPMPFQIFIKCFLSTNTNMYLFQSRNRQVGQCGHCSPSCVQRLSVQFRFIGPLLGSKNILYWFYCHSGVFLAHQISTFICIRLYWGGSKHLCR